MLKSANQQLYPINYFENDTVDNLKRDGSVAIIMRTKNRPLLLTRALESVIQQSYSNWHLYLINDGGDANEVNELVEINLPYLKDKITVIHNSTSLGMEAASNCGFDIATEEFMVVHDDDDSWHYNFLQETVNHLNSNQNAVAVVTKCLVIYEEINVDTVKQLRTEDWSHWQQTIDIGYLLRQNITPPICLLIRMNAAKQIGKFNDQLPVLGDWDYNLRLFRIGEIHSINEQLAFYHLRASSNNIYGNSVCAGANLHHKYQIEYRNSIVRKALSDNSANYGILHLLLNEMDKKNTELTNKINELNHKINDIQGNVWYLRRKSFPLKTIAAKIRDTIRKWKKK